MALYREKIVLFKVYSIVLSKVHKVPEKMLQNGTLKTGLSVYFSI